jgi:uncharacterized protein (TIGR03086 family)
VEPLDALTVARGEAERRLRAVKPDQWDGPTACEEWTVRDLTNHLVAGNYMSALLLDGASQTDVIEEFRKDQLGDDPVAAFAASADQQEAAFRQPGALDRTCHHMIGDIPGSQLCALRYSDLAVHAWDLARGLGMDEELSPLVVEAVWAFTEPMGAMIPNFGVFGTGASGTIGDDAPLQTRLLDLVGRRP